MSISSLSTNQALFNPALQYTQLAALAQQLGLSVPPVSDSNAIATLQAEIKQAQEAKKPKCADKAHHAGHGKKFQEYLQLVQQAQALGIRNIPQPVKGQKGSLDIAMTTLQAEITQAQQGQASNGNGTLSNNSSLFAQATVGLLGFDSLSAGGSKLRIFS